MFKSIASVLSLTALLAVPTASHAVVYTFNASLSGANEVLNAAPGGPGSGTAILAYNDNNTLTLDDDTYNFAMSVFGLSGGSDGKAANAFHIHGAANTAENGPVRVALDNPSLFTALNSGSTLLVGGNNVAAPTALFSNGSYSNLSFLAMLRANLTYVNVHTSANPAGAVRGQLFEVTVVPEPSTYAMLLAGLGVVGLIARRRRAAQV
jgi:hypothetical protein